MYVFRIHIRPRGGQAGIEETFAYCLRQKILGVGWRTDSNESTKDWEQYFREASEIHDNLQVCKYLKKWVSSGDLVWTRDSNGNYYLARVISGWEYLVTEEAIEKDIDVANVFRVEFQKVEIDMVPGKIVACFRASRTIQEIADHNAREYSKFLWNYLTKTSTYEIESGNELSIFTMLDDEETEDLFFLYLQSKGWFVMPNSRKKDTMSYEFYVVNPETSEIALTQVKTGDTFINKDDYSDTSKKVLLFQTNDLYEGENLKHLVCVSPEEILKFIESAMSWLPEAIRHKIEIGRSLSKKQ